jgi:serine/threonine-protein kinase PknG
MSSCNSADCTGVVDDTGFCDTCGLRPEPPLGRPWGSSNAPKQQASRGSKYSPNKPSTFDTGRIYATSTTGNWSIAGLVSMPVLEFPDPGTRVIVDPQVPEQSRVCAKTGCGTRVGRSYAGQPALTDGYCPKCGTAFSFSPKLRPGDLVADQYRVVGCIARGGLGWIYLARDLHLDENPVVLKGLINTNDAVALELAVAERRFLTSLDHPNIVRIFNFVLHQQADSSERTGYIVMEYLKGQSFREMLRAASRSGPTGKPLPLEHVLAYGHEILAALEYLHGQGLLYCDMKPENVIRCEDRVKVVDLGGVRRLHDQQSVLVGTPGYQVDRAEIRTHGLTVRSDIYALGKTLKALSYVSSDTLAGRGDMSGQGLVGLGVESFRRLIARATDETINKRFASANEMADQLRGVLRELLSIRHGKEHPDRSNVFAPSVALLDAGLGAVPPLDRWTRANNDGMLADGRPTARSVAVGLAAPMVASDDPAADFLATVSAYDLHSLVDKLAAFPTDSAEIQFRSLRCYIELGALDDAAERLAAAVAILGDRSMDDWRVAWHRGLLALARDDVPAAFEEFDHVYGAVPGEATPKLALGYCAERLDIPDRAEAYYEAVWQRDHTHASAAFGLARVRLYRGDRAGAVEVLDHVPQISRHYDAARVAAVRIWTGRLPTGLPSAADFQEAIRRLPKLHLDGGDEEGESRHRLTAAIREAALAWVSMCEGGQLHDGGSVLGKPPTDHALRVLLEESFRTLAVQARNADDHAILVDLANSVRPQTWR